MTDKEIIQALECCIKPTSDCDNCPLDVRDDDNCFDRAKQGALNIINRQQAEIEKLNVELVGMRGACNSYKMHYDNAKAEIEKLNNLISKDDKGKLHLLIEYNEFDNLVKEMVGDDK